MKNFILLTALSMSFVSLKAQNQNNNTTENGKPVGSISMGNVKKERDTAYTKNDTTFLRFGKLGIVIKPKSVELFSDSSHHHHQFKKAKNIENNWLGLDLGLCGAISENIASTTKPASLTYNPFNDLKQTKSINVKFYLLQQRINLINHHLNFRWGMGITWNNFRFNNNLTFATTNGSPHIMYAFSDSLKFTKNKLVNKYLTVPLMLEFSLGKRKNWKSFRLAAGAEFNLYLDAWQKQISAELGKQKEFKGNYNFSQTPINLVVRLGVGQLTFYGTYAITPMFNSSQQSNSLVGQISNSLVGPTVLDPQSIFHSWAIGIQLNGL